MSAVGARAAGDVGGTEARAPFVVRTLPYAVVFTILLSFVLLQKISVPAGSGTAKVQFALLIMYGWVVLLVGAGVLYVSTPRLILYASMLFVACATRIVVGTSFSVAALALFAVAYLPCIFMLRVTREVFLKIMRSFVWLGMGTSALVAFNWATQLAGLGLPLNLDKFLPEPLIFREYAYVQLLHYGGSIAKPNAVFFLETSVVSQFLAMALVIELCFFQRFRVLAVLAGGLFSTFGGTGIVLLAAAAPFLAKFINRTLVVSVLAVLPVAAGVAFSSGLVDNFARRSADFDRKGSSAQSRFVRPVQIVGEISERNAGPLLLGMGPGTASDDLKDPYIPALVKSLHEYGLIFTAVWLLFTVTMCWGRNTPWILGWCSFVSFHCLNASFAIPLLVYYPLLFAGAYHVVDEPD